MFGRGFGYGYPGMMEGGHWLAGGFMMLLWLLFVLFIVVMFVRMFRGGHGCCGMHGHVHGHDKPATQAGDEAVTIAQRRLAQGEITPEQYAEIIAALKG